MRVGFSADEKSGATLTTQREVEEVGEQPPGSGTFKIYTSASCQFFFEEKYGQISRLRQIGLLETTVNTQGYIVSFKVMSGNLEEREKRRIAHNIIDYLLETWLAFWG